MVRRAGSMWRAERIRSVRRVLIRPVNLSSHAGGALRTGPRRLQPKMTYRIRIGNGGAGASAT